MRQGDIISNVQILGAINYNSIQFLVDQDEYKHSWTVTTPPSFSHCMVLSHSCEIDPSNDVKLISIILAPLRDINKATSKANIENLIKSNIIDEASTVSYLKYFYLEPHDILPYSDGAVVDFSKCFSVRNKSYNILMRNKSLQLEKFYADKMALKLSLYFYKENLQSA